MTMATTELSSSASSPSLNNPQNIEAEGLILTWTSPTIPTPPESSDNTPPRKSIDIDVVVVNGVYHSLDDYEPGGPSSGTGSCVDDYIESLDSNCRILRFKYNPSQILAGHRNREAIRKQALRLLDDLVKSREKEPKKRLIIFVGHDIGGIIVKDALVAASLNLASWGEIFDYNRLHIFCGCPHRSTNSLEMEEKLSRYFFIMDNSMRNKIRPSVASIPGLAAAVIEINGLFVLSKVYLRSYVVSIHATDSSTRISQVFDNYVGVLGIPTEKTIAVENEDKIYPGLHEYLKEIKNYFVPEARLLRYERILLSFASPLHHFKTVEQTNHWTTKNKTCQEWLKNPGSHILYVQDTDGDSEAIEQIFYSLQAQYPDHLVLYFSFDRHDVRCNSVRNMLSTFLAQIICHYTTHLSKWVEKLFGDLSQEYGWTEFDLFLFFEIFISRLPRRSFSDIKIVINYFDDCNDASRRDFLEQFSKLSSKNEEPWKIAITSRNPVALLDELSDLPHIALDIAKSDVALKDPQNVEIDIARFFRLRPDLYGLGELLRKEMKGLADLDPLARYVVCEHARLHNDWPEEVSIQQLLYPRDNASDRWDNSSLASILDQILRSIPDQVAVRRLFSWLLYCVRPLTIWELATVVFIGTDNDKRDEISPSFFVMKDLISKIKLWLAGIVEIEHNEIKIQNPRLRSIFMAPEAEGGPQFIWNELRETAHADITKLCLEYLSRASVQRIIEEKYQALDFESVDVYIFPDRSDLCSYVVQAWTHHFSLSALDLDLSRLLDGLTKSTIMTCWSRAYWTLSNPFTRSSRYFESLYSVFVRLGISNVVEPGDSKDFSLGLIEAAASGRAETVKSLLVRTQYSKSTLLEAIIAAGSIGGEQIMLDLVDHVLATSEKNLVDWPPKLLYRAAWLGLGRLANRLLDLGCKADSDVELQDRFRTTPLYLAARNGHVSTVQALVNHNANPEFCSFYNFFDQTPLLIASARGHVEIVKNLVEEAGSRLEWKDPKGDTSLCLAAKYGNYSTVEKLLYLGADPNMGFTSETIPQTWLPLGNAAYNGYLKCVRALLEYDANPNLSDPSGTYTPLTWAACEGHLEICQLLLMKGADPNYPSIKPPILIQLIIWGRMSTSSMLELVKLLLENHAFVDATDEGGNSALIYAVQNDYEALVNCLLDYGANINLTGKGGKGSLHLAVDNQKKGLVELLLQRGADVNCQTSEGLTPLHAARSNIVIVRLLLENNANLDNRTSEGYTELIYAASNGYTDCIQLLLEYNAAVDAEIDQDNSRWAGWTAVSFATYYGYAEIVRLLADAGADLKHKTKIGECPLHLAVDGDSLHALMEFRQRVNLDQVNDDGATALHLLDTLEVPLANVKLLVNGGADLNVQDKMGMTPLIIAANKNLRDVVSFFLKQDLDVNLSSGWEGTALHHACVESCVDVVKMLVEHGANVNFTISETRDSPLQSACLQFKFVSGRNDSSKELVHYLLKNGADINAQGWEFGNAISAAAFASTRSIVSLLLEEGATTDIRDEMGRLPIHFAAASDIDNFQLIYNAYGDIKARDKIGRTVLHWAALPGCAKVVDLIISLLSPEAVDEPDLDGWTPLCWAARGTSIFLDTRVEKEVPDQINVIKILLKHGADRFVRVLIGEQKLLPWMIARYCGADAEIIDLLKHGLEGESRDDLSNSAALAPEDPDTNRRRMIKRNKYCSACLWSIRGLVYTCMMCFDFDFCSKCYTRRDILHASHPDHTFQEIGLEFEMVSASGFTRDHSNSSSPSSDSEYDSEVEIQSENNGDGDGNLSKVDGSNSEFQDTSDKEDNREV